MHGALFNRRNFIASQVIGAAAAASAAGPAVSGKPTTSPRFALGLVTYNLAATWDLPTLLRIADGTGIAALELRTTHGHGVEPKLSASERRAVKDRIAQGKVKLWGLGTVCEFQSTEPSVVDKNVETCKEFLRLGADLGVRGVKVRPNGLPKDAPVEKTLTQIGKAVRRCGQAAADLGLEVWVEVHGPGTSLPRHMKAIMEACDHPSVGVTWNSNREDIEDGSVAAAFELLRPWIRAVHINELFGMYPYRELFGLLAQADYDRYTMIEIPQKLDPAPGELLLRYYKALWTELCRPAG